MYVSLICINSATPKVQYYHYVTTDHIKYITSLVCITSD